MPMRTITLEEHIVTHDFLKATNAYGPNMLGSMEETRNRLLDIGQGRIASMDANGIDMQVLSLAAIGADKLAPAEQTAVMRGVHDELAAAVKANPDRFRAFASPPMKEPANAVKELERCIQELGFVGALLDGTTEGKFLDAPEFFPVLEAIAALDVPLYLHPAPPPKQVADVYFSGLPGEVRHALSIAGWGWHAETGLHILRLITAGIFERLPALRVIVGHMGEGVPYALARSSSVLSRMANLKQSVADTFKQNFHVTTSGYFTKPPFDCARTVLGLDRLMYSVDYPFSPNEHGAEFVRSLQLTSEEQAAFCGGTAASLLRL